MTRSEFCERFFELTGHHPLSWQSRLYDEWATGGHIRPVIDLPTGLGKTMVMAIWLIARSDGARVPARLVYVVDRRTVVDQATDLAQTLRRKIGEDKLAISTLRGQLADNHEWSRDPSRPAIVIGTVDLIGSALLFSGYRSSYKRRPLEAGLLGQDSLLVLDEAHLSKPFEKLITSIAAFHKSGGRPMQVVRMSATSAEPSGEAPPFALELDGNGNLTGEDAHDDTIATRFRANKRLTVRRVVDSQELKGAMADAAIALAKDHALVGKRIVVFVRKPDDARDIAKAIREHRETRGSAEPFADAVELLTGTMRGLERDELVDKAVFKERWLNGDLEPGDPANRRPAFLVSTSAGEVGFDLNADHLVGDAAPLDSWIQRLGRVNRRGHGEATVVLVKGEAVAQTDTGRMTDFDKACLATSKWLTDGMDVSPKSLAALTKRLTPGEIEAVSSPKPATVDLTDILLDGWSLTSITESMPGRPEVAPWLRGLDTEQAQTTVAWRTEIDLFRDHASPERVLEAIFIKHPIRPHESLTLSTGGLLQFLKRIPKLKGRPHDLMSTRVAVRFPGGRIAWQTLQELADEPRLLYADSTLVLPATFGGLDSSGMLDADAIPRAQEDNHERRSWDVADRSGYERTDEARSRLRIVIEHTENGSWKAKPLPGLSFPGDINLEASYEKSATIFSDLRAARFRVRLVQPIEVDDDEGDPVESLVILASAPKKTNKEDQALADHVGAVEAEAKRIVDALNLKDDDPARIAALFAAKWHDEGKKAPIWQFFANNSNVDHPLGKMAQARDPQSLRGYRHEFGSLLRIQHPERCGTTGCDLPADSQARELALHLIATHHGAGRPHFTNAVYDPFIDAERDAVHLESIRRFARLQRKYGWWHLAWLENLLRCADQLASADEEVTEIDELGGRVR